VSRYQKGKSNLDFTEARDSEWQWHQLGHMHVCISLQTDNHASTPPLKFFTGRMPFLPPNQQRQSTEGTSNLVTGTFFYFFLLVSVFLLSASSVFEAVHNWLTIMGRKLRVLAYMNPVISRVAIKFL